MIKNLKKCAMVITVLALAFVLGACSSKNKVDLRLSVKEGDSFSYKITMDQVIKQDVQQMAANIGTLPPELEGKDTVEISQLMSYVYKIDVLEAGKTIKLKMTYEQMRLKMESEIMPEPFVYDSSNTEEQEEQIGEDFPINFDFLIGQSLTLEMTPKGELKEIRGLNEMIDKMLSSFEADPAAANLARQNFESLFSDETFENLCRNIVFLPEGKVGVGDSWEVSLNALQEFPLIINSKLTVTGIENGVVTVKDVSDIKTNPESAEVNLGYIKMSYDISGEQEGEFLIDQKTGLTLKVNAVQKLKGTMTMMPPAPNEEAMFNEMSMPIDITTRITAEQL